MASTPHCKGMSHLHVGVVPANLRVDVVGATYDPAMSCENHVTTWGVVVSKKSTQPLTGLHLLPDAVAGIPLQLFDAAAAARVDQMVMISHTFNKTYVPFCTLYPQAARNLGLDIEAQAKLALQ